MMHNQYCTLQDGTCQYNPENIDANCTGYIILPSGDENRLLSTCYSIDNFYIERSKLLTLNSLTNSSTHDSSTILTVIIDFRNNNVIPYKANMILRVACSKLFKSNRASSLAQFSADSTSVQISIQFKLYLQYEGSTSDSQPCSSWLLCSIT